LAGGVLVARSQGYLGGRDRSGPIPNGGGIGVGYSVKPGQVVVWDEFSTRGASGVKIESLEVVDKSPGLETVGTHVILPGQENSMGGIGWPPEERSVEARGTSLRGPPGPHQNGERLAIGLRVPAAGVYVARGLRVRYRQGRRRYESVIDYALRVCAGPERGCGLSAYKPSTDRGIVFAGGFVTVPASATTDEGDLDGFAHDPFPHEDGEIRLKGRSGEAFSVGLTLFNTGDDVEVRDVRLPVFDVRRYAVQAGTDLATESGVPRTPVFRPLRPFRLRHGEARAIRVRGRFGGCQGLPKGAGTGVILSAVTDRGKDEVQGAELLVTTPTDCP
jgi:hypothetical protein